MPITLSKSRLAASLVPGAAVKTMMRRSLPVTVSTSQSRTISPSVGWTIVLRVDEGGSASKRFQRCPAYAAAWALHYSIPPVANWGPQRSNRRGANRDLRVHDPTVGATRLP